MVEESRLRGTLEIATAILLGLVSVATAAGAYQASEWSQEAGRYESISGQLRDASLSTFIANDLAGFDDGERLFEALELEFEILGGDPDVEGLRERQDAILAAATDGVLDDWHKFVDGGYRPEDLPTQSAEYTALTIAPTFAANSASAVAYEISQGFGARSLQLTVASVIFALSLLLLGVSGANASLKVAFALTIGGAAAFATGIVIVVLAALG